MKKPQPIEGYGSISPAGELSPNVYSKPEYAETDCTPGWYVIPVIVSVAPGWRDAVADADAGVAKYRE